MTGIHNHSPTSRWKIPLVLVLGVCSIAFGSIFFRLALPTHPIAASAIRLLMAAGLLFPWTAYSLVTGRISRRVIRVAILCGFFYAMHFGLWVWSLELTTVAASVTLVTATPILLVIVALISGRDRPDGRLYLALLLTCTGVLLIAGADLATPGALVGDLMALGGAAAIAAYLLSVRTLGAMDVWAFTGIATLTGGLLLVVTGLVTGVPIVAASSEALFYLFLGALIPQLIGHTAFTWALRSASPVQVGIATVGEPAVATFLAWLILAELPATLTLFGCAFAVTGVFTALVRRSKAQKTPSTTS